MSTLLYRTASSLRSGNKIALERPPTKARFRAAAPDGPPGPGSFLRLGWRRALRSIASLRGGPFASLRPSLTAPRVAPRIRVRLRVGRGVRLGRYTGPSPPPPRPASTRLARPLPLAHSRRDD